MKTAESWFKGSGRIPFPFQLEAWKAFKDGYSGLVNAPTGSGKTFSLALPVLECIARSDKRKGLKAIWITPIRALTNDLTQAIKFASEQMETGLRIEARTGDTSQKEKSGQLRSLPDFLLTTPESLHLLISNRNSPEMLGNLDAIIIDEWHELVGSKRGVQVELALSVLKKWNPDMQIWGISATIGNLKEATDVLFGSAMNPDKFRIVKAKPSKKLQINSVLPDKIDELPWAGHLGIKLIEKVIPVIMKGKTTLLFTNTRGQAEIWFQCLLDTAPDLAGSIAMHHGSLSMEVRGWVEENLQKGNLKAVVCTSSLDLGIDYKPVDQVIQVGSPKGIARFLQRAGRSGHQPGAVSQIWFVPTHGLELLELEALKDAIDHGEIESKQPLIRCFDVLSQFLLTLACGPGFYESDLYEIIQKVWSYSSISKEEWCWILDYLTRGGQSLDAYDEFNRLVKDENGRYLMVDRKSVMRHKLSIGTIVGDVSLSVKYLGGGSLGSIEEYFAANLKSGDVFGFAGKSLEFIQIKNNTVYVRKSNQKPTRIPSWNGGRMPLSSEMGRYLRNHLVIRNTKGTDEYEMIKPILTIQDQTSVIPASDEFLIEKLSGKDGFHLFFYPFEGRLVHEGMAALIAYRIMKEYPISISFAMNDYGFELLSDTELDPEELVSLNVLGEENIRTDLLNGMNSAELARRKFRDIAHISGLIFRGYPGKVVKSRHLQASSGLFFDVFTEYDPDNLLLQQAYEEILQQQYEENRLREAMKRINLSKIRFSYLDKPSPLAFPILVDRLRDSVSNESLADRVKKLELSFMKKKRNSGTKVESRK